MPDSTNASAPTKSRELVAFERVDATIRTEKIQTKLEAMIPGEVSVDRFTQLVSSLVRGEESLMECAAKNFDSMILAIYDVAKTGLLPDKVLGQVYIVPFKGKAQMILGYRGMITLAMNSGMVDEIYANTVRAKDDFAVREGTVREIEHAPDYMIKSEERGPITAVYAVAKMTNGSVLFEVMTSDEVERIRSLAPSANSPAWKNHWPEMAKKTVVRRLCKYLPQSVQKFTQMEEHFDATGEVVHLGDDDYTVLDETTAHDPETGEVIEPGPEKKTRKGRPKGSRNKAKATEAVVKGAAAEPQAAESEQTDIEDAVAEAERPQQESAVTGEQAQEPQEPPAEQAEEKKPRQRRTRKAKILEGTEAPPVVMKDGVPDVTGFMEAVDNALDNLKTEEHLDAFWTNIEPLLDQMKEHDETMKQDVKNWFNEAREKAGAAPF